MKALKQYASHVSCGCYIRAMYLARHVFANFREDWLRSAARDWEEISFEGKIGLQSGRIQSSSPNERDLDAGAKVSEPPGARLPEKHD
jgi:hypothetical protein